MYIVPLLFCSRVTRNNHIEKQMRWSTYITPKYTYIFCALIHILIPTNHTCIHTGTCVHFVYRLVYSVLVLSFFFRCCCYSYKFLVVVAVLDSLLLSLNCSHHRMRWGSCILPACCLLWWFVVVFSSCYDTGPIHPCLYASTALNMKLLYSVMLFSHTPLYLSMRASSSWEAGMWYNLSLTVV